MKNNFSIGTGFEMYLLVCLDELFADTLEIVYLTIEYNAIPSVIGMHRLIGSLRQVNDT
jgi:hypothetical protein